MISNVTVDSGLGRIVVSFVANGAPYVATFGKGGRDLLAKEGNRKIDKGSGKLQFTASLSLFPHIVPGLVGGGNLCSSATKACVKACVAHNGNGMIPDVQLARIARRLAYTGAKNEFLSILDNELTQLDRVASWFDKPVGVRLNTFSDLPWEHMLDLSKFNSLRFYDYSKVWKRASGHLGGGRIIHRNYRIAFSCIGIGDDWQRIGDYLDNGGSVACVFADSFNPGLTRWAYSQQLPKEFQGYRVIDGDKSDDRFHDKKGVIVGLRLKARSWNNFDYAVSEGFAIDWRSVQIAN